MSFYLSSFASLRPFTSAARLICRFNSTTSSGATYAGLQSSQQSQSGQRTINANRRKPTRVPQHRSKFKEEQRMQAEGRALERFQTRAYQPGDIYAPHDLSPAEMKKWKRPAPPSTDVFDTLQLNPLDQYKNFSMMSEYMTHLGRIKHRSETGLRGVNQRKLAKAVRRAIGLGLMPSVHRHPEILAQAVRSKLERSGH
ncbi:ribosomal protein S18 [Aspergillus pseudoustus]|uniref:Small ribosomal subunit protein bS18m n=1 Tax=Aspergillus pseudoustus TaxID=1810923 RepID=A0ABR4JWB2_9EURO